MLSRPTNLSSKQAAEYYEKDDYYSREKASQFACYWHGKGAKALGLSGTINADDFRCLLDGHSPQGKRLHAKLIDPETHRAGTDYVFNAPKSISVQALVANDVRLIEAHDQAVRSALDIKESRYAQARSWNPVLERQEKVCTQNLTSAIWRHETNRNQDPHLHSHDVDLNVTQDGVRWKAVSNELAVKHQKLLGQIYQNDLAHQARQLGYEIDRRPNGQFELNGYPAQTLAAFSTRGQEIESRRIQLREPESARVYQRLAVQTRSRKTVLSHKERQEKWTSTIQQEQLKLLPIPQVQVFDVAIGQSRAKEIVQQGIDHLAEQEGIFRREQLERHILENSLGQCPFSEITAAIDHAPELVPFWDYLTTRVQLDLLDTLEQLLGLNYAKNETGQTEQAGITQTDADRDSYRDVGNRTGERLAAAISEDCRLRESTNDLERSLEQFNRSHQVTGVSTAGIAGTVAEFIERQEVSRNAATIARNGTAIATALESVAANLERLEHFCQEFAERDLEREAAIAEQLKPSPTSAIGVEKVVETTSDLGFEEFLTEFWAVSGVVADHISVEIENVTADPDPFVEPATWVPSFLDHSEERSIAEIVEATAGLSLEDLFAAIRSDIGDGVAAQMEIESRTPDSETFVEPTPWVPSFFDHSEERSENEIVETTAGLSLEDLFAAIQSDAGNDGGDQSCIETESVTADPEPTTEFTPSFFVHAEERSAAWATEILEIASQLFQHYVEQGVEAIHQVSRDQDEWFYKIEVAGLTYWLSRDDRADEYNVRSENRSLDVRLGCGINEQDVEIWRNELGLYLDVAQLLHTSDMEEFGRSLASNQDSGASQTDLARLGSAENIPLHDPLSSIQTEFVLDYAYDRLEHNHVTWIDNDAYWAEHDPETGVIQVGRKADNRIIASAKLGRGDERWDILHSSVQFEDWYDLLQRQQVGPTLEAEQVEMDNYDEFELG